jgi:hypothetical protein
MRIMSFVISLEVKVKWIMEKVHLNLQIDINSLIRAIKAIEIQQIRKQAEKS